MTTFVKPCLNCDLNFVMKSSRKRPLPKLVAVTTFGIYPLQLDFSDTFKLLYKAATQSFLIKTNT